ncbi:MAG: hypothetical protein ACR2QK_05495 [Acidimicrobiales bacterium]
MMTLHPAADTAVIAVLSGLRAVVGRRDRNITPAVPALGPAPEPSAIEERIGPGSQPAVQHSWTLTTDGTVRRTLNCQHLLAA